MYNILVASNDFSLLYETKEYFTKNFQVVDMWEANHSISITFRDQSRGLFGLFQKEYISWVLERFSMQVYSGNIAPIQKGEN